MLQYCLQTLKYFAIARQQNVLMLVGSQGAVAGIKHRAAGHIAALWSQGKACINGRAFFSRTGVARLLPCQSIQLLSDTEVTLKRNPYESDSEELTQKTKA